jgi:hypothetical protein
MAAPSPRVPVTSPTTCLAISPRVLLRRAKGATSRATPSKSASQTTPAQAAAGLLPAGPAVNTARTAIPARHAVLAAHPRQSSPDRNHCSPIQRANASPCPARLHPFGRARQPYRRTGRSAPASTPQITPYLARRIVRRGATSCLTRNSVTLGHRRVVTCTRGWDTWVPEPVGQVGQGPCEPHRNPTTPRHGGRSPQESHGRNGTLRYTCYAC